LGRILLLSFILIYCPHTYDRLEEKKIFAVPVNVVDVAELRGKGLGTGALFCVVFWLFC